MPVTETDENPKIPDQLPMPPDALPDIVVPDAPSEIDDRMWRQQAETVFFRPLCLNVSRGYWMNLLKVTKSGVLSRHGHANAVHGFVRKGHWHYLEHDWIARDGSYVYEPPDETPTLVIPDEVDELITCFHVNGVMYYVDPYGNHLGYEDVITKIGMCRAHFEKVGLSADYVKNFIH